MLNAFFDGIGEVIAAMHGPKKKKKNQAERG